LKLKLKLKPRLVLVLQALRLPELTAGPMRTLVGLPQIWALPCHLDCPSELPRVHTPAQDRKHCDACMHACMLDAHCPVP
jgi:hypothetical protein